MNLAFALSQAARRDGNASAITTLSGRSITYSEFEEQSRRLGTGLLALGLEKGDRVVLAMSNAPEYLPVLYGAWCVGLCVAPMNARLHAREIAYAVENCSAKVVIATPDLAERLSEVELTAPIITTGDEAYEKLLSAAPCKIEDVPAATPAWLFYTSGTTGRPKGAVLTHRNLQAMVVSYLADTEAGVDDAFVHITPQSHAGGLFSLVYVARGLNQIILPTGRLSRDDVRKAFELAGRGTCFAVPTLVKRFVDEDYFDGQHQSLHKILIGGAPLYAADLRNAISYFGTERLWPFYGQGESPCTITHLPPSLILADNGADHAETLGSVGIPRSGVSVRIARDDGSEADAGEVGEVIVKGDVVMEGYLNEPEATSKTLRNGWLHTGDLGYIGKTGLLTLVDRSKDVIISGGSNIYPREVEEVLLLHPHVREAAVVGISDPQWGERPIAYIVAEQGAQKASILQQCREHLAAYKIPSAIHFVDSLPESSYGKVLKSALRQRQIDQPS